MVYLLQQQGQELNELVGWQHLHIGLLEAAQLLFFGLNRGRRFQTDIQAVKSGPCGSGSYLDPSLTESDAGISHCCVIPEIQGTILYHIVLQYYTVSLHTAVRSTNLFFIIFLIYPLTEVWLEASQAWTSRHSSPLCSGCRPETQNRDDLWIWLETNLHRF